MNTGHPESTRSRQHRFSENTRDWILVEASELFARHGYAGTSTRMIAEAVQIRQPSLFHHFQSKAEIMEPLLRYSLEESAAKAEALATAPGPASARLAEYLRFDVHRILSSPYNLMGVQYILSSPDALAAFDGGEGTAKLVSEHWKTVLARLRGARRQIISDGVERREFIEIDVDLADDAVSGLVLGTIVGHSRRKANPSEAAKELADFALRALIRTRPS